MTHGRSIQIRHHVPRQSIEARRSRSFAERCSCSPMRLRSVPALLLKGFLCHASMITSAVAPQLAGDVVTVVGLMSGSVPVCRRPQLGGSMHRQSQNGGMEMQQQHRPEGASNISPDNVRLLPDQQTDREQQPPPAVLDEAQRASPTETEQGRQHPSGR